MPLQVAADRCEASFSTRLSWLRLADTTVRRAPFLSSSVDLVEVGRRARSNWAHPAWVSAPAGQPAGAPSARRQTARDDRPVQCLRWIITSRSADPHRTPQFSFQAPLLESSRACSVRSWRSQWKCMGPGCTNGPDSRPWVRLHHRWSADPALPVPEPAAGDGTIIGVRWQSSSLPRTASHAAAGWFQSS